MNDNRGKMQKKLTLIATVIACGCIAYMLWNSEPAHTEEKEEEHATTHKFVEFSQAQLSKYSIETSQASSGTLQDIVRAPASIVIGADHIAHILPKASGIAQKAYKNLGEKVIVNDLLATLESRDMAEAKTAYLTASQKAKLTTQVYQQEKTLHEKKISATQDFNIAQNEWESTTIELELARQKLHALGLTSDEIERLPETSPTLLRQYELRSPIAGQIIARHITTGELIDTNQEIYIVADLSVVWAEINIFAQDRHFVKKGQKVTISANDKTTEATIIYLSPIIDNETRTSLAIAEIDNSSQHWLPGTFAQAELQTKQTPVNVMVPREAVQNIDGENALFVADSKGFIVRPITIGRADELHYEVLSGINAGETYAYKNTFLLKAELQKDEAEHMD